MKEKLILKIDNMDEFIGKFNEFIENNGSIIGIIFLTIIGILITIN